MIEKRIKSLIQYKDWNYQKVETETGIREYRWGKALNGHNKLRWEEVEAICKLFPEYAYWITTGKTIPEAGQISPDLETTAKSYQEQGKG